MQTVQNVPYGGTATYTGSTPVDATNGYPFEGWSPSNTNIQGNTTCYAKFTDPYEYAEITDSWDDILANITNGTYATKYKIGNYKPLDLGTEGTVNMQIVAFDTDDKADSSGKAPITFIDEKLLATSKRMNPSLAGDSGARTVGTGSIGGWENTEMRSYLINTVKAKIPSNVRSRIVAVKKTSFGYNADETTTANMSTSDEVWIPSYREIFGGTGRETEGAVYSGVFNSAARRQKMKVNGSSAAGWWLRSATGANLFRCVGSNGGYDYGAASGTSGVALGFCLG